METTSNSIDKKFIDRTVFFTSLGCSKNLVDAQVMLGHMGLNGFQVVFEPNEAEVIVVNTCSFIEAAKQESVDTILELADFKEEDILKMLKKDIDQIFTGEIMGA